MFHESLCRGTFYYLLASFPSIQRPSKYHTVLSTHQEDGKRRPETRKDGTSNPLSTKHLHPGIRIYTNKLNRLYDKLCFYSTTRRTTLFNVDRDARKRKKRKKDHVRRSNGVSGTRSNQTDYLSIYSSQN